MANFIQKTLATGNAKLYYQVEKEFVAVGTLYTNADMHYVAAHPQRGLWLSGIMGDNNILPIGFIEWTNIKRIIVDDKNERVFVVVNDYDSVVNNADFSFKKMYKKAFTHTFEATQEKSILLTLDLFSGNILPYLEQKCNVVHEEVDGAGSTALTIVYVVIIILVAIGVLSKIFG